MTKGRPLAQGKIYIIFGFFLENKKHPIYMTVMLLDVDALAAYQQDPNPDNSLLALQRYFKHVQSSLLVIPQMEGTLTPLEIYMLDSTYCLFESFISKFA